MASTSLERLLAVAEWVPGVPGPQASNASDRFISSFSKVVFVKKKLVRPGFILKGGVDSHSSPPAAHDTRAGRDSDRNDEPVADGRQQQHSRTADDDDYDTQNEADGTGGERDNEGEAREGEPTEGPPVEDIVPRRARPNHYPMLHYDMIRVE